MRNSSLAVNHPEWLLTPTRNLPTSLLYLLNDGFHLLDFGNPEALAWAKQTFSGMIGDVGIDIYRHDCNILPSFYWNNNEPDDRRGIREIRHVTGLYEYFDTLLADHPDLLIDNVASGGRRMDFEMLRRSLVLTRTDFLWNSDSAQSMTHALSHWVPWTGLGTISVNPYDFRSGLGAHFVTALNHNSSSTISAARSQLMQHRQIRHIYSGDFYPLTSYSTSNRAWIAWQYHRADLDEGFVQIFRRAETPVSTETFKLEALDPNATYALTDWDIVGAPELVSGADLMETGITLSFPIGPRSAVIVYERR
jgi:alpha-galactosidase